MTKFKIISFIILLSVSGVGEARDKKAREPKAAREIRAILDKQVAAWNRGDLEGFMAHYWNSTELSFYSGGTKTFGWQQTIDRYRSRYQSEGREMGKLDFSDLQIELLGPSTSFVRGRWHLKMKDGDPGGLFTLILRKQGNGWKIIHDHTSSQ
jgi:beta-aspartyl-peptidase (threonine type)